MVIDNAGAAKQVEADMDCESKKEGEGGCTHLRLQRHSLAFALNLLYRALGRALEQAVAVDLVKTRRRGQQGSGGMDAGWRRRREKP